MARRRNTRPQSKRKASPLLRRGALPTLILFFVLLVGVVIIAPWEPTRITAVSVTGTDLADGAGRSYAQDLHVTEVMSSNRSALPDENGSYPDWIELTNTGTATLELEGYGLSDRADKISFMFPEQRLEPGERVIVYASDSSRSESGKPFHAKFKLSSKGDTVYLFTPDGVSYENIEIPPLDSDIAYALSEDGWVATGLYSPGYENTQAGYEAFLLDRQVTPGVLMINEILASNRTTQADEDGDYPDWIELYNSGSEAMDLSGFGLSDNPSDPMKWMFPEGTILQGNSYLLVFASKKDRPGGDGLPMHTNFGLAAEGESVVLSDTIGRLIDRVDFENLQPDTSWGRQENASRSWALFLNPTPGMPNNRSSEVLMDQRMIANNSSGVIISEVLTSNTLINTPDGGSPSDYIELYNTGNTSVNLSGYGLSDRLGRPRKWQLPDVTIGPQQYLVIYTNGQNRVTENAIYASFNLSIMGETVVLSDPTGKILDKVNVPQLVSDVSYGRSIGQSGLFYYATPSPGTTNGDSFLGFAETPTILTQGGMYPQPTTAEIDVPENSIVRYTMDGSDPTEASMLYQGPIAISGTTVLRARSWADSLHPSQTVTQTYFVSVYHSLPVFSLVTDPDNLWNEDTGMLADGPNLDREGTEPPWFKKYATYGKKLHYDGHIEFYDEDGNQLLSQGMNFHAMGQYSLDMPQKSFAVNATQRFAPGRFQVDFWDDRTMPEEGYKNIVLRNGGQDGQNTRVIDGLQARIAEQAPGTTVITQAWTPVIVYLNGVYWGHYNLRERINRYTVAAREGWEDPDALDLLESDGLYASQVRWGSNEDYKALIAYIEEKNLNLSDPDDLQYVTDRVDIDNMFDYFIFEMYFGNTDPGNIRFYRKHGEGEDSKWRFLLYDLDWGLYNSNAGGPAYVLNEKGMGNQNINNVLIRGVLSNPEMQDKFLRRMGELYQTIFQPDYIIEEMNKMLAEIRPELLMHYTTWAEQMHPKINLDVPKNPEGAYNYWNERVARAYNVIRKRPNIFWGMVQDAFNLSDPQTVEYLGERPPLPEE